MLYRTNISSDIHFLKNVRICRYLLMLPHTLVARFRLVLVRFLIVLVEDTIAVYYSDYWINPISAKFIYRFKLSISKFSPISERRDNRLSSMPDIRDKRSNISSQLWLLNQQRDVIILFLACSYFTCEVGVQKLTCTPPANNCRSVRHTHRWLLKGTLTRDFLHSVSLIKTCPTTPWFIPWSCFEYKF